MICSMQHWYSAVHASYRASCGTFGSWSVWPAVSGLLIRAWRPRHSRECLCSTACMDCCCLHQKTALHKVSDSHSMQSMLEQVLPGSCLCSGCSCVAQSVSTVHHHVGLELCSLLPVLAGRQHTAILMRLLLASIRPMVDSLQLWAEEGLVVDHLGEALICQGGAPRAAHMLPS